MSYDYQASTRWVLLSLRPGRTMTKHDVMRETGLPRTTVIRSLGELEKAG